MLGELETQVDSLKRQGRQASRYKNLSAEIRRLEALLFAIGYAEAREQAASAEREAGQDLNAVADAHGGADERRDGAGGRGACAARPCARPRPRRRRPCSA